MKKTSLSEQIVDDPRSAHVGHIYKTHVKDFIKELKKCFGVSIIGNKPYITISFNEWIDKLAGEELI